MPHDSSRHRAADRDRERRRRSRQQTPNKHKAGDNNNDDDKNDDAYVYGRPAAIPPPPPPPPAQPYSSSRRNSHASPSPSSPSSPRKSYNANNNTKNKHHSPHKTHPHHLNPSKGAAGKTKGTTATTPASAKPLSADHLAKLNAANQKRGHRAEYQPRAKGGGGDKKEKVKYGKNGKIKNAPPPRMTAVPVGYGENVDPDEVVVVGEDDDGEDGGSGELEAYGGKGSLERLVGGGGGGDRKGKEKRIRAREREKEQRKVAEKREREREESKRRKKKYQKGQMRRDSRRVISGPLLEEGRDEVWEYRLGSKEGGDRGGGDYGRGKTRGRWSRRRKICLLVAVLVVILAIAIPVGIVTSNNNSSSSSSSDVIGAAADIEKPSNRELDTISKADIPESASGTLLDPFAWYDTTDFNVTYTEETVGGLSVMGLNSTWDDDVQCNPNVPPLNKPFPYGKQPYRGVNVGGWLNVEPFITPSFFEEYNSRDGVIDEYTLTANLGPVKAARTLERHYSSFVNADTFAEIRDAGFDHVRFPYGYWAVATYEGDPYVPRLAWRYLLRAIEWCRQNGLRVKLDMHGAPGSQNGWNHSGKQGYIGWLNGTDGQLNGQRTLEIHEQLSAFFAQRRYRNVVTMYGLVNEPRMVELETAKVLAWTREAVEVVRGNGVEALVVFGDGFMGLDKWQGELQDVADGLVLDVHQYVIFNVDQLALEHADKINFACKGWTAQTVRSQNKKTGFGPTMCGEWSQADTDCVPHLNNVGVGSRWEGTLNTGNASTQVLTPVCPTRNDPECECNPANAPAEEYTDAYKLWLLTFAQAQMESFEKGYGWFYWTWDTENAVQWSYKKGLAAGILPEKAYDRPWKCSDGIPDFQEMGLPEYY